MSDTNYDEMSDDDFIQALDDASSEPKENTEEDTNIEDTNQENDFDENESNETETTQDDDETLADTGSEDEYELNDELEGNTQIEDSNEEEEVSTETNDDSDDSETNESPVEDGKETDEVNYEEQYKNLLSENDKLKQFENFYDEVTSEFTANGKKVKGFTDPKKVIESQQMAAGFSDKMASFSKYKPFMNSIKDNGFLDNPEKFNLAMSLLEGNEDALKKHIKDLKIDPFEMDMENINYQSKNQVSSDLEVAYSDVIENAKVHNVDKEVQDIINRDWDDKSVIELLEDPQSSADLVNHISSGAYKVVQERISEKKRTDANNVYSRKPVIQQYREAAREIELEYESKTSNQNNVQSSNSQEISEKAIQTEIKKIETERQNEQYRAQVEKKNAKADEARKKATSVSKKKPRAKNTKNVFDPSNANDDQFTKYLDSLIYS